MADKQEQTGARNLRGQVARLVDLVNYQDASVVSRQIIGGKTGSVTLFAFDEGQELSEHTTPYDALVQLIDGEAEVIVAGKLLRVKEGDVVLMPANEPHAVRALRRFKMVLTMIRS